MYDKNVLAWGPLHHCFLADIFDLPSLTRGCVWFLYLCSYGYRLVTAMTSPHRGSMPLPQSLSQGTEWHKGRFECVGVTADPCDREPLLRLMEQDNWVSSWWTGDIGLLGFLVLVWQVTGKTVLHWRPSPEIWCQCHFAPALLNKPKSLLQFIKAYFRFSQLKINLYSY